MTNTGYMTSDRTAGGDECLTPRYAVEPIIKYLKGKGYNIIWCPFDKSHSMFVRVLKREGFIVKASHIQNGGDFFTGEPDEYDCIVSNPPFSKKDKVLKRLYSLNKPFAVILPLNAMQSVQRVSMYIEHGIQYLGFDRRIGYYTNGEYDEWKTGNHFASAYFCKDVLPEKLIFEKITPVQEPYYDLESMF